MADYTRMQQRRGTASQWSSANPILAAGEIGVETDTNKFKIGDGVTDWSTLTYFEDSSGIQALIDALVTGAPESLDTLNELAAAINDDPDFFNSVANSISSKLDISGGTLTGSLTLDADPTTSLEAATKQYVDAAQAAATQALGDLTDVNDTMVDDGYTITYDLATSTWLTTPLVTSINELIGVDITTPQDGDTLIYSSDTSNFINTKSTSFFPENIQTADYTITAEDLTQTVTMKSSSNATIFIPFDGDADFPDGSIVRLFNDSDSTISVDGAVEDFTVIPYPINDSYEVAEIIYANNLHVAVLRSDNGLPTSDIAVSTDGLSWTVYNTLPSAQLWSCIAYDHDSGRFLLVAGGVDNSSSVAAYSDDNCQTWTASTLPTAREWVSAAYGDGFFVVVGDGTASAPYSTDGINWTTGNANAFSAWRSVEYADGNFVAVATGGSNSVAYVSALSPASWSASTLNNSADWLDLHYADNKLVAIGSGTASTNTNLGEYSEDGGVTWTQFTLPVTSQFVNVKYDNGNYIVSDTSGDVHVSSDLVSWKTISFGGGSLVNNRISAANYKIFIFADALSNEFGSARIPVLLRNKGSFSGRYTEIIVRKRSANEWVATGNIS